MDAILSDAALEDAIVASQDAALQRLQGRDFSGTLLRFVDRLLQSPPRQAPDVAFDFWAQYEQYEHLEELRQYRPSLYRALPESGAR